MLPQQRLDFKEKKISLGIIRVEQIDISLHDLCEFIHTALKNGGDKSDFHVLVNGDILGRKIVTAIDYSGANKNIGMNSYERTISREHVNIIHIEEKIINSYLNLQLSLVPHEKTHLCHFLSLLQYHLPNMEIQVNRYAKNSIKIY